ncbi:DUF2500 domain-containing protein [Erwinia tasmaniensis]|uniref:Exported protein n=1 Tax=Erwinia tasmaniensis (strain DSM 17950 / CFBP 7177 / CIP 109463 / NCPPB 4357 / Et1/99) TaxID=465817 RepID=B2VJN6_ERWT9|nr:Putative exported protein [Erwinia tasmaniensis Et1/99]
MKPPIFLLLVLVIIAILATRQFIKQRREVAVNDATPLRSLRVEVKSKREYPAANRRSRQREHLPVEEMRYEAWFHPLNEAGDFKLELKAGDYHQMDKGTLGELRFKGTRFVSFKPDAEVRRN